MTKPLIRHSRQLDCWLCFGPHYFGRGKTPAAAFADMAELEAYRRERLGVAK